MGNIEKWYSFPRIPFEAKK